MGPFSLDLHDRGSKPAAVRAQIRAAMDHFVALDSQELAIQSEDLRSSARTLGAYAGRLHEENAVGHSLYSARTQLLALGKRGPRFEVPVDLLSEQRRQSLAEVRETLRLLGDVAEPAQPRPDHPWAFVRSTDVQLAGPIRDAAMAVETATSAAQGIANDPVVAAASTPEQLSVAAALLSRTVPLSDIDLARTAPWREEARSLVADVDRFATTPHTGLDVVTPDSLALPVREIHAEAVAAANAGFFKKGKRQKAVLARLQSVLRPEADVSHKRVQDLTSSLLAAREELDALHARVRALQGVEVAPTWNPLSDAASMVRDQVDFITWASDCVVAQPGAPAGFVEALRQRLSGPTEIDSQVTSALGELAEAWGRLRGVSHTSSEVIAAWCSGRGLVTAWAQLRDEDVADPQPVKLRRWLALNAALEPLERAGLAPAAELLRSGEVHHEDALRALERGLAAASVQERARATGLDTFDAATHGRAVARFAHSARQVRAQMTRAVPQAVVERRTFDATSGRGLVGELQRELAKQRRALGVRALMERYGDLITQLMPCVLVSPDSVARFFPVGSQVFDIVVFDEASQIRVADAVGAMGRGRSVVVVGDSKQMPPTTFGESLIGDDDSAASPEDEVVVEDTESILTEAVSARVPQRWLTWHYRSKDESLIAFSNVRYYDGKLSSFPSPNGREVDRLAEGRGVSLVRVNGQFQRSGAGKFLRTNPVEARAIVDDLARRFSTSPDEVPSVGVVTFNLQQRTLIEAIIRDSENARMIAALDDPQGEGLFVKNLENVQGDERDVILFSTAFSVNDKGVLPLNFGPLTRAGGERRLNVAVTRARRQVVLFTSFEPSQLRVDETQSIGVRHLREYLELAQRGPAAWAGSNPAVRAVPDRHRDEVAAALEARGLVVTKDVGLSEFRVDIALSKPDAPDQPLVAVLLDGPSWAARRTVGDRDGLPVQVLEGLMHWPAVERVWTPEWVSDPEGVLQRLETATAEAIVGQERATAAQVHRPTPIPMPEIPLVPDNQEETAATAPDSVDESPLILTSAPPVASARGLAGEARFEPFFPRRAGGRDVLDQLPSSWAGRQVGDVLRKVVSSEGPVHPDRLARLVATCFDLTRLNQARIQTILATRPSDLRLDAKEKFVWPPNVDPNTWSDFRRGDDRPLEHVSLREIGNAMVSLSRSTAGMTADELDSEALAVFGGKRRTSGISARLEAARNMCLDQSRLTIEVNGLYVAS